MEHEIYRSIAREVRSGRLREPFSAEDFRLACPGFAANTYLPFPAAFPVGISLECT